jgi:hypothetical protein
MKRLAALCCILLVASLSFAGTITGQIATATGGLISNGTLSFTLSQPALLVSTATVITTPVSCYTSTAGSIVGVPDPLVAPVVSTNTASGTLAAGTYYVKITYTGAAGESIVSPEASVILSAQGTLIINGPVLQPASATGYKVYIGATSGSETLQGSVTGFGQFSQTAPLAAGSAVPVSNSSSCSIAFSDQLIPTGTSYSVNLVNKNGSKIAGFPQTWCTYGGQAGTINVANGAPVGNCGTNGVFYPTPIFANPANGALQSISGPLTINGALNLGSFPLTAGAISGSLSHPVIDRGLGQGTGIQHVRITSCQNSGAGLGCNTTITWPVVFDDANYTATCNYESAVKIGFIANLNVKTTTGMIAAVFPVGSGTLADTSAKVNCIAIHD